MATQETWEKQILKELSERNKATVINGSAGTGDIYERASFDLYEFTPNRDLDQKSRAYLAGPEWSILQQSSLLKAGHDLLGDRLGYTINFEEWFEDFEYEFQNNLPSSKRIAGSKLRPWGKDIANRPKKLNLLTKEQARKKGYMIIRFWKDRTVEDDSKVFGGTYIELRQQLLDAMRSTAVVAGDTDVPAYSTISFRGLPTVMLNFREKSEDVEAGYTTIQSRVTFRLPGRTDDPKTYPNLSKLTNIEVINLAKKIKDSFLLPEPYKIHRGKETVSCKDKVNGIDGYLHVFNKQDGIDFFTKIYGLLGKTINTTRIFHKITENSVQAYPTIPERTNVLGRDVKRFRERPVGYVHFTSARLFLSLLDKPIVLCSNSGDLYQGTLPDT
ncbi:MAG: hypothetical protein AAGJ08_01865 [Cyanobacteria bacterium P01_H01_bin.35]